MVQVGSGRRVRPAGALRLPGVRALRRLAVVTGLVAGGWLVGASAAHAADDALAEVPVVSGAAGRAVDEAQAAQEERETRQGQEAAAPSEAEPSGTEYGKAERRPARGVSGAVDGTVDSTVRSADAAVRSVGSEVGTTVGSTVDSAEGAVGDRVVADTVRSGREGVREGVREIAGEPLGEPLRTSLGEGELASAVSEGLGADAAGTSDRVRDGLGRIVGGGLGAAPEHPASRTDEGAHERDRAGARARGARERAAAALADHAGAERPAATGGTAVAGSEGGRAVEHAPAPDTDGAWNGSDSAATGVSSSPFPAPAAGFWLQQRGAVLRPAAQRAFLPGDPALVVRDAADDPSYSPD
ncbi:hypothetical protein [Nocardiopsis suaedae]|uniref:Uncharacterized protein n=1 Tax=Nocardiopsis suaedae TaxID=3018444 RepID=A0ABT4TU98_9ACTN|nr:hypothetical protein [Nocardiopsis suaedae]MDA2807732.1 hypothetical protein [Nocardiopsis suaedae]